MRTQITLLLIFASFIFKAQDLSFEDIKNCSKRDYQKAFIANLLDKKYKLIKQDSTKNGKASYYAFNKDSSELLITVHSYNMVDFKFTSAKNKIFMTLLKEIHQNYKTGCFGGCLPNRLMSKSFNASTIDYKTMAIFYSEYEKPDIWHLVLVSPYSDVVKVKHSKQEGILCSAWYSVCVDPRE